MRVLIAEDDPELRALFRAHIQAIPGFEVVGLALDEQRAIGLSREVDPEIIVIGLDEDRPIAAALQEVRSNCPQVKVLVVTSPSITLWDADGADAVLARPVGADTFVTSLLELADEHAPGALGHQAAQ